MEKQINIFDTLNYSQRVIAEDLLSKVERALKSNNEEPIENRIFSITASSGYGKSYLTAVLIGEFKKICDKIVITAILSFFKNKLFIFLRVALPLVNTNRKVNKIEEKPITIGKIEVSIYSRFGI